MHYSCCCRAPPPLLLPLFSSLPSPLSPLPSGDVIAVVAAAAPTAGRHLCYRHAPSKIVFFNCSTLVLQERRLLMSVPSLPSPQVVAWPLSKLSLGAIAVPIVLDLQWAISRQETNEVYSGHNHG